MIDAVVIKWRNGFGNQLFQYSYGKILAKEKGYDLVHDGKGRICAIDLFEFGFLKPEDIKRKTPQHNCKYLINYSREQAVDLENPHVYSSYLDKIKTFFPTQEKTNNEDLVVHLRLGDNGPNIYTPFEWYKKAIEDNNIKFNKLFLVTDEPQSEDAIKFKTYYNANIVSKHTIKTDSDRAPAAAETVKDFNFIRQFDKILFSNSTFAWWAAVLSNASEVYFNNEWQPNHHHGQIKLGETNYKNFKGICPFSLKD